MAIPAFGGRLADHVQAIPDHAPEGLGAVAARKTTANADDGERLVPGALNRLQARLSLLQGQVSPLQRWQVREAFSRGGHCAFDIRSICCTSSASISASDRPAICVA